LKIENRILYNIIEIIKPHIIILIIIPMLFIPFWFGFQLYNLALPFVGNIIAVVVGILSGGTSFWFFLRLGDNMKKKKPYPSNLTIEGIDI